MNITLGQYYPTNSIIHRLDPRVKIMATMGYIIALFIFDSFWGYLAAGLFLGLVIKASKVPFALIIGGIKSIILIIVFTLMINAFFTPGEDVLFEVGIVKMTKEGIIMASKMAVRLIMLIIGSSVLTLTTSPIRLTDAIERLLAPYKKIGVPAHEIAMMMTIALRFIPTLVEELDKIRKAQVARGADFETGSIMQKAKSLVPLLVPLFVSSFRRADELAMAMEARCYRGDYKRTRMNELVMTKTDKLVSVLLTIAFACVVAGRILFGL